MNEVIWIIGASSGFGEALARQYSAKGAKLILSARREVELKELAGQLSTAKILTLDLAQPEHFADLTQQAVALYGQIDRVIFAGAIAQNSAALDTPDQLSDTIFQIDYRSYTQLTRQIAPHFIKRQTGHFVVISGLLAQIPLPGRSTYAAAKSALLGYFACLRLELMFHNIDITLLIPGSLKTELASKAIRSDGSINKTPVPQIGCEVDEAARQAVNKIDKKVYQAYIGKYDKAYVLWRVSQLLPNLAIKLMIKQLTTKK